MSLYHNHINLLSILLTAQRNGPDHDAPPPYTPPTSGWYAAPPVSYLASRNYGWMPPVNVFPNAPPGELLIEYFIPDLMYHYFSKKK